MAIEIETKNSSNSSLFINILFYLSIILLIGASASYFTFNHLEKKTEEEIKSVKKEIDAVTGKEMLSLEDRLELIEAKTSSFKKILNSKKIASKAIPFLEKISHPKVYFTSAQMDPEGENEFTISGRAENYQVLEQQLIILRKEEKINKFSLDQIKKSEEGGVGFELSISATSDLF